MSLGIYLFQAIRVSKKIGHFSSYYVQFLHFIAKNGTISSKFPIHDIENVKILWRTDGDDFMKLHLGYLFVCTKIWYGYFLSRRTLRLAPSLVCATTISPILLTFLKIIVIQYWRKIFSNRDDAKLSPELVLKNLFATRSGKSFLNSF